MTEPLPNLPTLEGYDRWSESYDDGTNPMLALDDRALEALLPAVAGLDAVDLGCGTGRHTIALARAGARVTGVDASRGMLNRAQRKAVGLPVRFLEGDVAGRLLLADAVADLVLSTLVLEHIADLGAFFAEARRIARPGARGVFTTMHPAMFGVGVQARFVDPVTGRKTTMTSHDHPRRAFLDAAAVAGWRPGTVLDLACDAPLCARFPSAERYLGTDMVLAFDAIAA